FVALVQAVESLLQACLEPISSALNSIEPWPHRSCLVLQIDMHREPYQSNQTAGGSDQAQSARQHYLDRFPQPGCTPALRFHSFSALLLANASGHELIPLTL